MHDGTVVTESACFLNFLEFSNVSGSPTRPNGDLYTDIELGTKTEKRKANAEMQTAANKPE
jgi:hypothetical protein